MSGKRGRPRQSYALARQAFVEVFGDPYAQPESLTGHYQAYKSRGLLQAMKNDFDQGKATRNPAQPNVVDFCCDVERVLSTLTPQELYKFQLVYLEESDLSALDRNERQYIEQRVGRKLRERGISPVRRYFTSIRRSLHK